MTIPQAKAQTSKQRHRKSKLRPLNNHNTSQSLDLKITTSQAKAQTSKWRHHKSKPRPQNVDTTSQSLDLKMATPEAKAMEMSISLWLNELHANNEKVLTTSKVKGYVLCIFLMYSFCLLGVQVALIRILYVS